MSESRPKRDGGPPGGPGQSDPGEAGYEGQVTVGADGGAEDTIARIHEIRANEERGDGDERADDGEHPPPPDVEGDEERREDIVGEASEESFPASDPPAYTFRRHRGA